LPIFNLQQKHENVRQFHQAVQILWLGRSCPFCFLVISESINNPQTFTPQGIQQYWRVCYVIVIHFILFEYTIPFIRRKRGSIFINILLDHSIVFVQVMLYSWGLYAGDCWYSGAFLHGFKLCTLPVNTLLQKMSYSVIPFSISAH
jgi:hypothetical protein